MAATRIIVLRAWAARQWAASRGIEGDRSFAGWINFYNAYSFRILNEAVRAVTPYVAMSEMCDAPGVPVFVEKCSWVYSWLADEYDLMQSRRGSPQRAIRR